ncbi:glycosyltransferase family protein [Nocardioides mangrovicus]|uniref:glycosyltransferase family protein n=1 Tax=Nocardioides mangrovicus TaxID=2478913 RepID=UPI0011C40621|nr:glycosyltransferase [Nocardioides mangrovicus]
MTRALILSEHDLAGYEARFARGEVPSALPYGAEAVRDLGWETAGVRLPEGPVATKLRQAAEHRYGGPLARQVLGVPRAFRSDLVLALLETQAGLAGRLERLHVPPYGNRPLVVFSCWLADDVRRADTATRRRLARRFASVDLLTHMSRHETATLVELGISEERLLAVPFGVADRYYTPGEHARDIEVLAVGQDRGRDYATLLDAVRGTDLRLQLVCRPENLVGLQVPENVTVLGPVPLPRYRELLRRAQVVAVPTHDLSYPTGQSVALEAASTGGCVVVTGTRAMRDYFSEATARLLDVGDAAGWRATLLELREDADARERLGAAARDSVLADFTCDHMWQVVVDRTRALGLT